MTRYAHTIPFVFISLVWSLISSCGSRTTDHNDGRTKLISGYELTVVSTEVSNDKEAQLRTVVFSIGPDESTGSSGDVMFSNIADEEEYYGRLEELNFRTEKYFALEAGEGENTPVLANFENTHGLTDSRKIVLVFYEPEENTDLKLRFDGRLFKLGIIRFNLSDIT